MELTVLVAAAVELDGLDLVENIVLVTVDQVLLLLLTQIHTLPLQQFLEL
jgi:hypothetical protein